jgi:hypothetical protein
MGDITIKPKTLKCKIINIEQDPKHLTRTIVSLRIDDGEPETYIRAFSLANPERPISLEEFQIQLASKDLSRPDKPFHYLHEAKDNETEFVITPADHLPKN